MNMSSIKKTYFSYSQINTFLNCPQKYKLLYVNKIKLKSEGIEAFIGKIVHEVLEWIYKNKVSYLLWDNIQEKYFKICNKKWHNYIFYFKRNMLFEKYKYKYKYAHGSGSSTSSETCGTGTCIDSVSLKASDTYSVKSSSGSCVALFAFLISATSFIKRSISSF